MTDTVTIRLPCPECGTETVVWTLDQARRFAEGLLRACEGDGPIVVMPPPPRG